jgi:hypothetical protein
MLSLYQANGGKDTSTIVGPGLPENPGMVAIAVKFLDSNRKASHH